MRKTFALAVMVVAGLLLSCGCATTPKRDLSRWQGAWVGKEIGGENGECRMNIAGDTIRFQGALPQEWYAGTLALNPKAHPRQAMILVESCAYPKYINQTVKAIYKLEGESLTLAHNQPGDEAAPGAFARNPTNQTRAFLFRRQ